MQDAQVTKSLESHTNNENCWFENDIDVIFATNVFCT